MLKKVVDFQMSIISYMRVLLQRNYLVVEIGIWFARALNSDSIVNAAFYISSILILVLIIVLC